MDELENTEPRSPIEVGGNIGHYLPDHAVTASSIASNAQNIFDALEPKQIQTSPFDVPAPSDKHAESKYNRALDIAQQPLMVLHHINNGTLQDQDVKILQQLYPGLHSGLVQSLSNELINAKKDGINIPYYKRQGISMLMGSPLDSTMTPQAMQSIINSGGAMKNKVESQGTQKKASNVELKQINKVNDMYMTKAQSGQEVRKE